MTYAEKLKDPRWQKLRLFIMNRDNFSCQHCFDTDSTLHVHHSMYHGEPWDAPPETLITLCENCHREEPERFNQKFHELKSSLKARGFTSVGLACLEMIFNDDEIIEKAINTEPFGFSNVLRFAVRDPKIWAIMRAAYMEDFDKETELISAKTNGPA